MFARAASPSKRNQQAAPSSVWPGVCFSTSFKSPKKLLHHLLSLSGRLGRQAQTERITISVRSFPPPTCLDISWGTANRLANRFGKTYKCYDAQSGLSRTPRGVPVLLLVCYFK